MNTTTKTKTTKAPKAKTLRLTSRAKSPKKTAPKSTKPVETKLQQAIEDRAAALIETAENADPKFGMVRDLLLGPDGATLDDMLTASGLSREQLRTFVQAIHRQYPVSYDRKAKLYHAAATKG